MHKILFAQVTTLAVLVIAAIPPAWAARPADSSVPVRSDSAESGSINWLSLADGLREAKRTAKPILVEVYTDWCGFCRKLDKETLSSPAVTNFVAQNFTAIRVNAEDGKEGQDFAEKHNVSGFPTTLVLDEKGQLMDSIDGFKPPGAYLDLLQKLAR